MIEQEPETSKNMAADMESKLANIKLDEEEFVGMMEKIIGNMKNLQNSPPMHVPQESLTADMMIEYLKPVTKPNGPLEVRKIEYVEGRANLIIDLPASKKTDRYVSFIGSHMDAVPADPEGWSVDPFKLTRKGDKIFGRGVTDCSGHVAMETMFMKQLAESGVELNFNLCIIFIANEENSSLSGIGIDELEKHGELEKLKTGPVYWVDSADFGPTLGTAGMACWKVHVKGKKFHSGLPHKGINALECANATVRYLQKKFFDKYPPHEMEKKYKFVTSSSMKPTQIHVPAGGINQIPGECTIKGDIRFLPFYEWDELREYMLEISKNIPLNELECMGASRYELPDENLQAEISFEFFDNAYLGVAVDLESKGHKILHSAIDKHHKGGAKPFALTGSLPIIAELKKAGFDTQITGFGRMDAYHAIDEYGYISDFAEAMKILAEIVHQSNY